MTQPVTGPTDSARFPAERRLVGGLALAVLGAVLGLVAASAEGRQTGAVVRFEQASYTVEEGAGSVEVCLVRSGDFDIGFHAFISSVDDSATGGAFGQPQNPPYDYCSWTDLRLVFLVDDTRACFSFCIVDDSLEEGEERFSVQVAELPSDIGQIGSPSTATVTIVDDESEPDGLVVSFLDDGHDWPRDPLIPYQITVRNFGPAVPAVVVREVVPVQTRYLAAQSTPGWSCDPGPDEGSECEYRLGDLATGASQTIVFAVEVLDGTPESFEILDSFELRAGADSAAEPRRVAPGEGVFLASPGGTDVPVAPGAQSPAERSTRQVDCTLIDLVGSGFLGECTFQMISYDALGCCFLQLANGACEDVCLVSCTD